MKGYHPKPAWVDELMDGEPSKSKVPLEKSGGFRCSTKYTSAYSWRNRQPTFSPFRFYPSVTSYWTISIEPIETQIAKFHGARVFSNSLRLSVWKWWISVAPIDGDRHGENDVLNRWIPTAPSSRCQKSSVHSHSFAGSHRLDHGPHSSSAAAMT